MLDRWWDLDLRQRRLLAGVAAVVALVALVTGALAFTGGGDDTVALTTKDDTTSSTRSTTSTSSSTTTLDSGLNATSTSSTNAVTSTTKKGATTSTTRRSTATTSGSGGTTATTKATTTTKASTTSTTQTSGACNTGGGNAMANEIANLYCSYRASHQLAPSTRNSGIDRAAQDWAQHMADQAQNGTPPGTALVHNDSTGNPDPNTRYNVLVLAACDACTGWAENVAYNSTASSAWSGWLASGGHLSHIADARAGEYGVGAAQGGGYWWFVQDFGYYP